LINTDSVFWCQDRADPLSLCCKAHIICNKRKYTHSFWFGWSHPCTDGCQIRPARACPFFHWCRTTNISISGCENGGKNFS